MSLSMSLSMFCFNDDAICAVLVGGGIDRYVGTCYPDSCDSNSGSGYSSGSVVKGKIDPSVIPSHPIPSHDHCYCYCHYHCCQYNIPLHQYHNRSLPTRHRCNIMMMLKKTWIRTHTLLYSSIILTTKVQDTAVSLAFNLQGGLA